MSASRTISLVFTDNVTAEWLHEFWSGQKYCMLSVQIQPSVSKHIGRHFTSPQDNDPRHTAKAATVTDWLRQSPDLIPNDRWRQDWRSRNKQKLRWLQGRSNRASPGRIPSSRWVPVFRSGKRGRICKQGHYLRLSKNIRVLLVPYNGDIL